MTLSGTFSWRTLLDVFDLFGGRREGIQKLVASIDLGIDASNVKISLIIAR